MDLTVHEAAELLEVSEKTIYRWIAGRRLPNYHVSGQYRFNRAELLEWATAQRVHVSPTIFSEDDDGRLPGLEECLRAGGVFYRVSGADRESVLRAVVAIMPLPQEVDREFLLEVLMMRESLGSTGIGDGIAVPHPRSPIVMHIPRPMVSLCFLEKPVDFAAIDAKPVDTIFAVVSPTMRAHLNLTSRIGFAVREPGFEGALKQRALREDLLSAARHVDELIDAAPVTA
jgi:PTS system nitrogen regulatory IIA component